MTDYHAYATIAPEHMSGLQIGDQVFVTCRTETETKYRAPGTVWNKRDDIKEKHAPDSTSVTILIPNGNNNGSLLHIKRYASGNLLIQISPFGITAVKIPEYQPHTRLQPEEVTVEARISMLVNTPHGIMRVIDKCDDEYPGVWVELAQTKRNTTLAMVEYIPGGEGTCDYQPSCMTEMRRQDSEVPPERRHKRTDNDDPNTPWFNKDEVTEGFVTRAWPNEDGDEEHHIRTFHFGYQTPDASENNNKEAVE